MRTILTIFSLLILLTSQAQSDTAHKVIYTHVQIEPQFPAGPSVWEYFLKKYNLKPVANPAEDAAAVSFLVDENGYVSEVKIENAQLIDKTLLKKTEKVVQKFPRWVPAVQDGKHVSFRVTKYITSL